MKRHMAKESPYRLNDEQHLMKCLYRRKLSPNTAGKWRTQCGHDMTATEYRFAKNRKWHQVNCKRCLQKK